MKIIKILLIILLLSNTAYAYTYESAFDPIDLLDMDQWHEIQIKVEVYGLNITLPQQFLSLRMNLFKNDFTGPKYVLVRNFLYKQLHYGVVIYAFYKEEELQIFVANPTENGVNYKLITKDTEDLNRIKGWVNSFPMIIDLEIVRHTLGMPFQHVKECLDMYLIEWVKEWEEQNYPGQDT